MVLPRLVFVKTWEREGFGQPHPIVGVDDYWLNAEAKRLLWKGVDEALAEAGVADNGLLSPEFRRMISVLAAGECEFYAWSSDTRSGETGAVLVSMRGRDAVRLIRDDDVVLVDRIPANRLPERFLQVLPAVEGADLAPIKVPKSAYSDRPPGKAEHYDLEIETRYAEAAPGERLRELMRAERTGLHQMYAAVRDRRGRRWRSSPLSAIDLAESGRILTFVSEPPNAEPEINCVSGTWSALVRTLDATRIALEA